MDSSYYREFLLSLHELIFRCGRGSSSVLQMAYTDMASSSIKVTGGELSTDRKAKLYPLKFVLDEDLLGAFLSWRVNVT
jgi:hypothetical protein